MDFADRGSLAEDLRGLGLRAGESVLLHSSLRSVGWVCGGAVTVVQAFLDVLGPAGTLVTPAFASENRDPARWAGPEIPAAWWPRIRETMPAYDAQRTPCRALGIVAETLRCWPGAVRSPHPQTSFAAVGARAAALMRRHDLVSELGEESPLAALEAAGARVVLLGVGFDRCTAFHLAEYRLPWRTPRDNACVMSTPAGRAWVPYRGVLLDAGDFAALGADFERTGAVTTGPAGAAVARLFPLPAAVAFARDWLAAHRVPPAGPPEPGDSVRSRRHCT
ncbi:aminoglycoside 3'-phosphotransferase [Actinoplanes sp. SE50]|uniref:aminoglycoside N(3)-acetyltransferase n=1 Tax=unclassified Actinoplanes TaxID=2626549 RepID=UPI00023EBEA3|nr:MULTISPECIES: AAC(3) family N-acetyltransferase [unclassified Actinoplanes]AEV82389.1 aminoglycoside N3'-acetyltransferase [Actinoplanes sp. SE50/110]ATO80786.1 aminoglycoside 3'-phosphotransferase [Actinoplanes sp. SE50]SLL98194.1 aminoglycoside 3'-phosphotransferase [Actinoplanes sp. SE50/110]